MCSIPARLIRLARSIVLKATVTIDFTADRRGDAGNPLNPIPIPAAI